MQEMVLTISQLSDRSGLASSALRFYERKGLLRSVGREGGMRVFEDSAVHHLAVIDLLKAAGFTLGEIASIAGSDGRITADWREHARAKREELTLLEDQIGRAKALLQHYIDCPAPKLEDCPTHQAIAAAHARRSRR